MTSHAAVAKRPLLSAMATLDDVDIVAQLARRPHREADREREQKALASLLAAMDHNPRQMLHQLVRHALDLCGAHTAGISVIDGDVLRWEAVAGVLAKAEGRTMPRHRSTCGVCIDRNRTQLLHLADRCFPELLAEPRFVETLVIPFHAHGRPVGTVWIVSHTSDKTFDHEDERVLTTLSAVASIGWQLWHQSDEAVTASRRKDQFLATLGHELRNPLDVIATTTALLQQRVSDDPSSAHLADIVARQTRHASKLVDDLLDVTRIVTGKLVLDLRTVDLRTIVIETLDLRRQQLAGRNQVLTIELGDRPLLVRVDSVRVSQVVSNLVDNAAKYTPDHGTISVIASEDAQDVVLAVQDTGVGIAPEDAQSVFEPFTQLASGREASAGGLGLGLALVRSVTELHGGQVRLSSKGRGHGSRFTVRLPRWAGSTRWEAR